MAEDSMQEKTESATPKRRQDARKEGDVAKSQEIPSVFVLLAGILFVFYYKKLKSWDILEYFSQNTAILNGVLVSGDSLSNNIYELYVRYITRCRC